MFVGNDRKEEIGNDEHVLIGNDQIHAIGQNRNLDVGRDHKVFIGRDRWDAVGNDRYESTSANRYIEVGGDSEHTIKGLHSIQAGQGFECATTVYSLQASEKVVFKSPGGSITLDAQGIHLNGLAITIQGPVSATASGEGQPFSLQLEPEAGHTCVEKTK